MIFWTTTENTKKVCNAISNMWIFIKGLKSTILIWPMCFKALVTYMTFANSIIQPLSTIKSPLKLRKNLMDSKLLMWQHLWAESAKFTLIWKPYKITQNPLIIIRKHSKLDKNCLESKIFMWLNLLTLSASFFEDRETTKNLLTFWSNRLKSDKKYVENKVSMQPTLYITSESFIDTKKNQENVSITWIKQSK